NFDKILIALGYGIVKWRYQHRRKAKGTEPGVSQKVHLYFHAYYATCCFRVFTTMVNRMTTEPSLLSNLWGGIGYLLRAIRGLFRSKNFMLTLRSGSGAVSASERVSLLIDEGQMAAC